MRNIHSLHEQVLKALGFKNRGKTNIGQTIWRIKAPYYHWQIQVVLGDYPATNPNCGVVSLYRPKDHFNHHKYIQIKKKRFKIKRKKLTIKEQTIVIAHYVNTPERLHSIITSLTQRNC